MDNQNPYAAPLTTEVDESSWRQPFDGTTLANRWERFAGNFVDGIAILVALVPIAIVFFLIFPSLVESEAPGSELLQTTVVYFAMFAIFAFMNGYLLASRGQTIGKLLMKTQILNENDEIPPLIKVLGLRYFLPWTFGAIPGIGNIFNIANALAIFRENHRCIHDEFCKTKVVKYRPATGPVPKQS